MDLIHIDNLRFSGKHGVYEHERKVEQEFDVGIVLEVDTKKAAESDDINNTVDYDTVRTIVRDVIENSSSYLIEKLADVIAQKILKDKQIGKVTVTIKKIEVWPNGIPGVTVVRHS